MKRLVAASLSTVYFCTQIAFASAPETAFWKERRERSKTAPQQFASAAIPGLRLPSITPRSISALGFRRQFKNSRFADVVKNVPANAVNVDDVYEPNADSPRVVLIQDVHLNPEAQRNTAQALQALIDQKLVSSISVEGAFGPYDFARFRAFPDAAVVKRVADLFVQEKKMGAPSYVGITSASNPPPINGVDDAEHYKANVDAYLQSRALASNVGGEIAASNEQIRREKQQTYNPALLAWDRQHERYFKGELGLGEYLTFLAQQTTDVKPAVKNFLEAYRLEKSMDFGRVENERKRVIEKLVSKLKQNDLQWLVDQSLAYQSGRLGFGDFFRGLNHTCAKAGLDLSQTPSFQQYIRYALISDGLKAGNLLDELDDLEQRVSDKLAASNAEKQLIARDNQLKRMEKMSRFELTPKEWNSYLAHNAKRGIRSGMASFERFYAEADIRSEKMTANFLNGISGNGFPVLIIGGFHTQEVKQKLKKKNISYLVLSPRITKISEDASAYLSVFSQEKTPLDRLFAGEKLSINPTKGQVGTLGGIINGIKNLMIVAALTAGFAGSKATGTEVLERPNPKTAVVQVGQAKAVISEAPGAHEETIGNVGIDAPSSPGTWAIPFVFLFNVLEKKFGHQTSAKITFVTAGLTEGLLSVWFFWVHRGDPVTLWSSFLIWVSLNLIAHYLLGRFVWDNRSQRWRVRFGGALTDITYLKANYIAWLSSGLGLLAVVFGFSFEISALMSALPHALSNFHVDRRLDEVRRKRIEGVTQFIENTQRRLSKLLGNLPPPRKAIMPALPENGTIDENSIQSKHPDHDRLNADGGQVTDKDINSQIASLKEGNPTAALLRFQRSKIKNYAIVILMQPGTTTEDEGPGFKQYNDTVGVDKMNKVISRKQRVQREIMERVFASYGIDLKANAFVLDQDNKLINLAVDADELQRVFGSGKRIQASLTKIMNEVSDAVEKSMISYMTVRSDTENNHDIVEAVEREQKKKKLPKIDKFTLYWGVSSIKRNEGPVIGRDRLPNVDEEIASNAEALAAVNLAKVYRSKGTFYSGEEMRDNIDKWKALRPWLIEHGLILPKRVYTSPDRLETRSVLADSLIEAIRKKPKEEIKEHIKKMIRAKTGEKPDNATVEKGFEVAMDYFRRMGPFDFTKPFVSENEKAAVIQLAVNINDTIADLEKLRDAVPLQDRAQQFLYARRRGETLVRSLQARLSASLSQDRRMPIGSKNEYYGMSPLNKDSIAVLSVDFRGFGGLILQQIELKLEELSGISSERFDAKFKEAMLTLGDNVLKPFAASVIKMTAHIQRQIDALNRRPGVDTPAYMTSQFGGDDAKFLLPFEVLYKGMGSDRLRQERRVNLALLKEVFEFVPKGMSIRLMVSNSSPFSAKQNKNLEAAMTSEDVDFMADGAKKFEAALSKTDVKDAQVLLYRDENGAHWKIVATPATHDGGTNGANAKYVFSEPVKVYSYRSDSFIKIALFKLHQWKNPNASVRESHEWADDKLEASLIANGFIVSLLELPFLPGLYLLIHWFSASHPISLIGATAVIVLVHEALRYRETIWRFTYNTVAALIGVQRMVPPEPINGRVHAWTEKAWVRIAARVIGSGLMGVLALGAIDLDAFVAAESFLTATITPALFMVFMAHVQWNSFIPNDWRLSLANDWNAGKKNQVKNTLNQAIKTEPLNVESLIDRARTRHAKLTNASESDHPLFAGDESDLYRIAAAEKWEQGTMVYRVLGAADDESVNKTLALIRDQLKADATLKFGVVVDERQKKLVEAALQDERVISIDAKENLSVSYLKQEAANGFKNDNIKNARSHVILPKDYRLPENFLLDAAILGNLRIYWEMLVANETILVEMTKDYVSPESQMKFYALVMRNA